jgi:hypothetical protein
VELYLRRENSSRHDLFQHATRSFISEERALNGTISFNTLLGALSQKRGLLTAQFLSTRNVELYLRRENSSRHDLFSDYVSLMI